MAGIFGILSAQREKIRIGSHCRPIRIEVCTLVRSLLGIDGPEVLWYSCCQNGRDVQILAASILVILATPVVCLAEGSIGRLTAQSGVRVDGIALPAQGIPSWPIHAGSVIETSAHAALVMLAGNRYEVAPHSRAIVEKREAADAIVKLLDPSGAQSVILPPTINQSIQVRTAPWVTQLVEISVVDNFRRDGLGPPPPGPPCANFPPFFVALGLVRCTP